MVLHEQERSMPAGDAPSRYTARTTLPAGWFRTWVAMKKLAPGVRAALLGAALACLGAFRIAALMALVYRFPVPLAGYMSGFDAVMPSVFAVVFYGLLGGFPVLGALGALAGGLAYARSRPDVASTRLVVVRALLADVLAVSVLATLDKIIGPW